MFTVFFLKAQNNLGAFSGKVLNGTENVAKALEGATISVKNESTGFQAKGITNKLGFFKIEDLPLGGPYSLMISHVGFNSVSLKGFTLNLGDNIIIADVLLSSVKNDMAEIVVSGSSYKSGRDRIGVSTKISGEALNRIPTSS
jgi:hypothetical protein